MQGASHGEKLCQLLFIWKCLDFSLTFKVQFLLHECFLVESFFCLEFFNILIKLIGATLLNKIILVSCVQFCNTSLYCIVCSTTQRQIFCYHIFEPRYSFLSPSPTPFSLSNHCTILLSISMRFCLLVWLLLLLLYLTYEWNNHSFSIWLISVSMMILKIHPCFRKWL